MCKAGLVLEVLDGLGLYLQLWASIYLQVYGLDL